MRFLASALGVCELAREQAYEYRKKEKATVAHIHYLKY